MPNKGAVKDRVITAGHDWSADFTYVHRCIFRDCGYRELTATNRPDPAGRETLEKLLSLLQSTPDERDQFVSHLYQSRRETGGRVKQQGNPESKSSGASSRHSGS